ncbi:unnamed protein product (macronuclear) [Paramecium tetraurelia]|uniref:Uncharacterized protein n=1 Tax=Paramecium tetraurelia TaxID=5888 RepID=A0D5L1_PARTE|nr:uncharacterized protein GSPATT00013758001 [Paramecium tetraurelia]CAK78328.1 unnamed protein product [Paramecium tetraurelia]|eukprot:XP_001445725.1 hypothetical protein (macronuclear) [Paramecium tetraurelia strain d4-2]
MTEQVQDISEQLLHNPINDDKYWELKPSIEEETQKEEEQHYKILDQPQINEEKQKPQPGFWNGLIFQCIGDCLVAFCIEVFVRGLC